MCNVLSNVRVHFNDGNAVMNIGIYWFSNGEITERYTGKDSNGEGDGYVDFDLDDTILNTKILEEWLNA